MNKAHYSKKVWRRCDGVKEHIENFGIPKSYHRRVKRHATLIFLFLKNMDFPKDDYKKMLYTRHEAAKIGLKPMEPWKPANAARLMAIVHTFGNNEGFTLSPKFNVDREYIQDIYNVQGGRTPDNERFNDYLQHYIEKFEAVKDDNDPYFKEASDWIKEMYRFKLFC